jgi:O-antigen/teichoic acid export membrane protein
VGGSFNKNVLILLSGTVIAQAITILCSPLLTRLYTPKDFGEFALLFSLASVLMPLSMGRYEQAIVVAKDPADARSIAKGAALILLAMAAVVSIVLTVISFLAVLEFKILVYALPVFILFSGLLTILTQYFLKEGQFSKLNYIRIFQSISTVASQLILAMTTTFFNGLIVGAILGLAVAFITALKTAPLTRTVLKLSSERISRITELLKSNKDFPLKNSVPAFLDAASVHMPVLFISNYYSPGILGLFSLAVRIVSMPINLIGVSMGQVFLQAISNESEEGIRAQFKSTFLKLAALASIPIIVLLVAGPDLFDFVFGSEWRASGMIASIIIVPYGIRLVVSPLSSLLLVKRKFTVISVWQVSYFVGTAGVLFFSSKLSLEKFCLIYAISEALFYLVYFYLIRKSLAQ